jgi:hypothetical protein
MQNTGIVGALWFQGLVGVVWLLGSLGQAVIFLPLGIAIASAATTYDLAADWSNDDNPNGVWTHREGTDALPSVPDWTPLNNGLAVQPAWAPSTNPGNFLPAWFKSTTNNPEGMDFLLGDVVVHSTDGSNGSASGAANVIWTSPSNGVVDIFGAVWMTRDIGRSNQWTLFLNGVPLTAGNVSSGDEFNRAHPFNFANGSGGPAVLNGIETSINDVIELRIEKTSGFGDFVGVNFTITLTEDADDDGISDDDDNCPDTPNPDQINSDTDSDGDACDDDDDNDTVLDATDNCPLVANPDQSDRDSDGAGDLCDTDADGDGVLDANDACLATLPGEVVDDTGCSIDDLCPCENAWKNQGAYVSCVARAAEDFVADDLITDAEKDTIVAEAAESNCGS